MTGRVHVDIRGPLLSIVIDAPATRNALSPRMLCELADAMQSYEANTELRVAIVTGSGDRVFCAGGDLARTLPLMTGDRRPEDEWDHRLLSDPVVLAASGLRDYPIEKPVIAAVNGACMAAGFELLLGTDIRICSENASFSLPEVKRGVIPFAGSLARLARQIPHSFAMEILLTGEPVTAAEALRVGLVNRIVPSGELIPTAERIAATLAQNGPLAMRAVKRTVLAASGQPLDAAYQLEDQAKALVMASEDAREGPRAFMEKRPPVYRGR